MNVAQIETQIVGINGEVALGYHRLTVSVKVSVRPYQPTDVALVRYDGELKVRGKGGGPLAVGRLVPISAPPRLIAKDRPESATVHLGVELDQRRLKAIEDIRLGGDLTLTLSLWCLLSSKGEIGCLDAFEPAQYEVNQSAWTKAREQMGAGRTLLLEIPEPDPQKAPELARAVSRWQEAWQDYMRGDDRDAVGKCRLALEALSGALGNDDEQKIDAICAKDIEAFLSNHGALDKSERFRLIRRALKIVTAVALHEKGIASQIVWDRGDAFSLVVICAALLQRSIQQR